MVVETSRFALPPVEPIFLNWENLKVVAKRGNRLLLDNVMGIAQPGQLIALMGASGAGKTTLLNALLQRNIKGLIIEGTILVNGQEIGRKITKVSAYIQQQNLFIGTLTVKEHLTLQAQLRLPASFDKEQRQLRVTQVMTELDLKGCESSVIGVAGIKKGITSGEAKRLSFATEILTNPSLLFADEPTTGIDSYMAFQVVKVLERLACESRKTIICTIHQPASEIFEMFDRVLFLANAGVAFLGSPAEAVQFFGDCGHMIPEHSNPADFFIQTLAIVPGNEQQCTERAERIKTAFLLSKYGQRVQNLCAVSNREAAVQLVERGKASLFTLTSTLFQRSFIDNWRNPSLLRAKMVQKCVMGTFLGLLYLQTTMTQDGVINIKGALFYYISELTYSTMFGIQTFMPNDFPLLVREYHDGIYPVICYYVAKDGVINIKGALFYYISELTYSTMFGIQTFMPNDFPLLVREYHDGIYPVICYYVAKNAINTLNRLDYLPIFTMDGMVMVFVSYFMIGLHAKMGTFLNTLLTCMLIEWSTASVGIMISSVSPSYAVAVSISGPLLTVFSITGGLYANIKKIPEWIRWVQYFSWFRFGYESLITNEFRHHSNITCDLDSGKPATICESSGEVVMSNLNFDLSNLYFNMWMMAFYIICVYTIGYVGLVITVQLAR
ncbi:ABC transporter ATP-binding protein/permease wht-3 [Toxocara canis]|uniref:ABC transporter ATP-binding protein/permease wht-3 n=1 Tax=Toxocara canis TaxID=6265 RepID=A0A0B2W225_TOXCA|nr:ABC transporter ATP-binding protein/permease wht-3 [Toxocara canis]